MTFQYLFFDTYLGCFLQMVPFAAIAGVSVGLWKYRRGATRFRSVCSGLLAAYLTGLIGVTLLLRLVNLMWYRLIYGQSGGSAWFLEWTYNFIPDFWNHFRSETLANALLFVPFGILHPLAGEGASLRKTLKHGAGLVLAIELLQPVFGRAFDINDIILNLTGIVISAGLFCKFKR